MDEKISELATLLSQGATLNGDSLVPMTVELPMGGGLKTVRVKFSELMTALNYIPIPGTDVGNPVTGDIEMTLFKGFKWVDDNGDLNRLTFEDGIFQIATYDSDMNFIRSVAIGSSGVVPTEYFQPNPLLDGKPFVQQKYVDTAMIPLDYGDIVSAGGIENAQVYTTGAGTGIASVDLSPAMAIGKDVTVSDLGNNASTHNIQIDSGIGNTILYGGTASQDITLNTNGASVTIRKITATQFIVI